MDKDTLLHLKATVSSVDDEDGVIEVTASTSLLDRMGDVVEQDWELSNYEKNPVVLWGHNRREERMPIARAVKTWLQGSGKNKRLTQRHKFDLRDTFAAEVYRKIKEQFINTVSVGFIPLEWDIIEDENGFIKGFKFLKNELFEVSWVPVPANPEAVVSLRSFGAEPIEENALQDFYAKKLKAADLEKMKADKEEVTETETKAVTVEVSPFTAKGFLPESESWDGPAEQLKGKDNADLFAYKTVEGEDVTYHLCHHEADSAKAVWRGVAEAMAILMGISQDVTVPEEARKDVYEHLAAHYREMGKEAPDYSLVEGQVMSKVRGEVHALALLREEKHAVRLIKALTKEFNKQFKAEPKADPEKAELTKALETIYTALSKL